MIQSEGLIFFNLDFIYNVVNLVYFVDFISQKINISWGSYCSLPHAFFSRAYPSLRRKVHIRFVPSRTASCVPPPIIVGYVWKIIYCKSIYKPQKPYARGWVVIFIIAQNVIRMTSAQSAEQETIWLEMEDASKATNLMIVPNGAQSAKAKPVWLATLDILCNKENVPLCMEIQLLDAEIISHRTPASYAKRDT